MGHSSVRIKVRRRKVAHLAAQSRGYIVIDKKRVYKINRSISPVVEHKLHIGDLDNTITCPFTKHKFVPTNPHKIYGKFGIDITGYDWVEPEGKLWTIPEGGFKQPEQLKKYKKRKYSNVKSYAPNPDTEGFKEIKRESHNDFVKFFKNYPYTLLKMNQVEYAEKLVQHKVARWVRRNPAPVKDDKTQQDLFEKEFMTPWIAMKNSAEERFRDFVVSLYDKLPLTGRFKINKKGTATYQEELVAELKDINGEGHHINDLKPKESKLMKKAQEITDEVHAKRKNLVATNLRDHKRTKGRILLPKAA